MEHLEYYDGLDWKGLVYNHHWLIVVIEAAFYCESLGVEYIRYSPLKAICDEILKILSNYERSGLADQSFKLIIHSGRYKKFLGVEKVSEKETRIFPKIPVIKDEIKYRKLKNLNYGNDRLARVRNKLDILNRRMPLLVDSVAVSESLSRQTGKVRPLNESVSISDGASITVIHANPNKEKKKVTK